MISNVLKAPINKYFDSTTSSKILNKFSKDLSLVETMQSY